HLAVDLGIGFFVAAVVACLFHIRDFAEFFEKLASNVMLESDYLSRLDSTELLRLRKQAARELVKKHVKSRAYEADKLAEVVDKAIFEKALPQGVGTTGEY